MAGTYQGGANTNEAMGDVLRAVGTYMPGLIEKANAAQEPTAQAALKAAQSTASGWTKLSQDEQASNLAADTALLSGAGGRYAQAVKTIQDQFDPEAAQLRKSVGVGYDDLLKSFSLNGLSGGQIAAVDRGLNKKNIASGNFNKRSAINTVGNAMSFGDRFTQKQQNFQTALAGAGNSIGQLRSGFDASAIGSKPIGSGFGAYGQIGQPGIAAAQGIIGPAMGYGQTSMTKLSPLLNAQNSFNSVISTLKG